jgi:hypothetical protein
MTHISCDLTCCTHNESYTCQRHSVSIYDASCSDYADTTQGDDYQEPYYEILLAPPTSPTGRKRKPGIGDYRKKAVKGKRIIHEELTLFTQQDHRDPDSRLTEEKSGAHIGNIMHLADKKHMDWVRAKLAEYFKTNKPVIEYPDYTSDDEIYE